MRAQLTPLSLAADMLVFLVEHFRLLLTFFIVPQLVLLAIYAGYSFFAVTNQWPSLLPDWVAVCLEGVAASFVLVSVVTLMISGIARASWRYPALARRAVFCAALLVPVELVLQDLTLNRWFIAFEQAMSDNGTLDSERLIVDFAVFRVLTFVTYSLTYGLICPALGMVAAVGEFQLGKLVQWSRRHFLSLVTFAALIFALVGLASFVFNFAYSLLAPEWLYTPSYFSARSEALRILLANGVFIPLVFVLYCVPAIAVGLVYKQLSAADPQL